MMLPAVFLFLLPSAAIQDTPGELDPSDQMDVIDALASRLRDEYVREELGAGMAEDLETAFMDGGLAGLDAKGFAAKVTDVLEARSRDRHLRVFFGSPPPPPPSPWRPVEDVNHGFAAVEVLPGNIGYLELTLFASGPAAARRVDAAMNFLSEVDALLIDLRRNRGGGPEVLERLSTYLFEERVHLHTTVRRGGEPEEAWTLGEVPSPRLARVPVFVLTSGYTFSAAEAFLFGLKRLDRITQVGERTGGGGNFGGIRSLPHGFSVWLPVGTAYDPETGEGWEAHGLEPDLAVPAEKARDAAVEAALERLGREPRAH